MSGWFAPQWRAGLVHVTHSSGEYDRCKQCYWASEQVPAVPYQADRRTDDSAKALGRDMVHGARRCGVALQDFLVHWADENMHKSKFKDWGTIDCLRASDPKQWRYMASDGERWTFDPQNVIYAKAFHLAWPALALKFSNAETTGNILESILGVRNFAAWQGMQMRQHTTNQSVCHNLSLCVNSVHQFTQYTGTTYEDIQVWCTYVGGLR